MIFSDYLKEDTVEPMTDVDMVMDPDVDTPEGESILADQVEAIMQTAAVEEMAFWEGGEQALDEYKKMLNEQVMTEGIISSAAKNNNIVRLNTRDDLKRRSALAALMIAKSKKDPLWVKCAKHKMMYKKYKAMIIAKYGKKGYKIARISQAKHAAAAKKTPLPAFVKDRTGNRTTMAAVFQ